MGQQLFLQHFYDYNRKSLKKQGPKYPIKMFGKDTKPKETKIKTTTNGTPTHTANNSSSITKTSKIQGKKYCKGVTGSPWPLVSGNWNAC